MTTSFRPAIIVPTYNNAGSLPDVVARLEALGLPIFIVNDGSTDSTAQWLAGHISNRRDALASVSALAHDRNRGKAAALRTGFAAAIESGFTHAATIDSDGQLNPEDLPALLSAAEADPRDLILGARDDRAADYPARSRIGRRLSNLAIRLECGARVCDSQCGLRVYPLDMLCRVRCQTGRYGYEAAIIPHAVWAGCGVINIPVTCRYLSADMGGISHFQPWRDSLHGVALHARLLVISPIYRWLGTRLAAS